MDSLIENLGKIGRDKITGFVGVISACVKFLYGCDHYVLTPKIKDGKLEDSHNFDVGRIEILPDQGINPSEVQGNAPGGEDLSALLN